MDAIALNPRTEVGPNLADIASYCNGDPTTTHGFADAIFQLKALEFVARTSCVDVVRKSRARLLGPLNSGESPDNQVMLH